LIIYFLDQYKKDREKNINTTFVITKLVFLSLCLSVFQTFSLSVFLAIYLSISLSLCCSVILSFCLSVFLTFCLSVFLTFCLSVLLPFCLSVSLSLCLSISLSLCLSVSLTLCLSLYHTHIRFLKNGSFKAIFTKELSNEEIQPKHKTYANANIKQRQTQNQHNSIKQNGVRLLLTFHLLS